MSGIACGLNKGHVVTRFTDAATGEVKNVSAARPCNRKGVRKPISVCSVQKVSCCALGHRSLVWCWGITSVAP
jgi:hypothetical protein